MRMIPESARALRWFLALALTGGLGLAMPSEVAALELGKPAPDFALPNTNGETISLKQFRGMKMVLLEFFGAAFAPT